jgi:hypothetical protein
LALPTTVIVVVAESAESAMVKVPEPTAVTIDNVITWVAVFTL